MIVLGIDPGFGRVGYGVISYVNNKYKALEYGCISTDAAMPFSKRLNKIDTDLRSIIERYKIDSASIEDLFFNNNSKTAIKVAEARGVILNTLESEGIPSYDYTPLQVKLAIVGYGRAEKQQVKEMVKKFLNLEKMPRLDDTTDALAIAICHTHTCRFDQCIKK
ncbi:MAG: crossover junction endodeoxyribonuclease RuvC [Clostridia bacterium]